MLPAKVTPPPRRRAHRQARAELKLSRPPPRRKGPAGRSNGPLRDCVFRQLLNFMPNGIADALPLAEPDPISIRPPQILTASPRSIVMASEPYRCLNGILTDAMFENEPSPPFPVAVAETWLRCSEANLATTSDTDLANACAAAWAPDDERIATLDHSKLAAAFAQVRAERQG